MPKFILLLLSLSLCCLAQDVVGVADSISLTRTPSTVVLTITASSGDGSNCTLTKNAGPSINLTAACKSSDGSATLGGALIKASGGMSFMALGFNDITCLLGANPTAAPVAMGSVGTVPSKGVGWNCTTNATGGGHTPVVNGNVVWP